MPRRRSKNRNAKRWQIFLQVKSSFEDFFYLYAFSHTHTHKHTHTHTHTHTLYIYIHIYIYIYNVNSESIKTNCIFPRQKWTIHEPLIVIKILYLSFDIVWSSVVISLLIPLASWNHAFAEIENQLSKCRDWILISWAKNWKQQTIWSVHLFLKLMM